MKRRAFISLLGGLAAAWPLAARAQQPAMPVIRIPRQLGACDRARFLLAFRQGIRETGYVEGQTWRSSIAGRSTKPTRWPLAARSRVRRRVTVIAAHDLVNCSQGGDYDDPDRLHRRRPG